MYTLMQTLFGISFLLLVVGLIKPTWILRWCAKRTRLRAAGLCLGLMFLFGGIGGNVFEPQEEKQAREERYKIAKEQEVVKKAETKISDNRVTAQSANRGPTAVAYAKSSVEGNSQTKGPIIHGSIHEYSESPIIVQSKMNILKRPDGVGVHFLDVSLIGQNNSIVFLCKKDKSIEKITMSLTLDSQNELAAMETFGIAFRVVQIASGRPSSQAYLTEFIEWVRSNMREASSSPVTNRFGDTTVCLKVFPVSATSGKLDITIGDDMV